MVRTQADLTKSQKAQLSSFNNKPVRGSSYSRYCERELPLPINTSTKHRPVSQFTFHT